MMFQENFIIDEIIFLRHDIKQAFFLLQTPRKVPIEDKPSHRSERFNKLCPLLITKNNSQPKIRCLFET